MSTVSAIKTQIQDLVGVNSSDTTTAARLLRFINNARREMYGARDWDALKSYYQLNRIPDVTAGTVSITQDTRVVTGSSTAFTSAMVGRYINFDTAGTLQSQWYRISKVNSTTELIIEADYIGSDVSAVKYAIRKVFYRIPAAASKLKSVTQFSCPRLIDEIGDKGFLNYYGNFQTNVGPADKYQIAGVFDRQDTYTTGTVAGSQYSTTLTGTSTVWMDNVLPGDKITISSQDYYVKSVDSDTQITLYAGLTTAASGATYTATTNPDSWIIRFNSQPASREIIPIEYYGHSFDLLNDTDSDYFIRRHPESVIEGAVVWEKRSQEDESWAIEYQKWAAQIQNIYGESTTDNQMTPDFKSNEYK